MRFIIGSSNIKVFAKSVITLSKFGDEIYFEPLQNSVTIRTVNSSRSGFVCFSFKRNFFTHFDPTVPNSSAKSNQTLLGDHSILRSANKTSRIQRPEDDDDNGDEVQEDDVDPFRCKIPAKCLLSIFKNINSIEKNVEKCTISVKYVPLSQEAAAAKVYDYDASMMTKMVNKENEEQLYETKFLIIMHCKYGLKKNFILSISDCENLDVAFSILDCTNKLNINAKYLNETINSFSNDTEEVTVMVEPSKVTIKNYVQPELLDSKSLVNTNVNFDCDEFNIFDIEKETEITFCLKEFKVCLAFGNWFDLNLDILFKKKGRPIIFGYNSNNVYEVNFTLATLSDDLMTTQNTISSSASNPNMTVCQIDKFNLTTAPSNKRQSVQLSDSSSATITSKTFHKEPLASTKSKAVNQQPSKSNKRALYDASNNQSYLRGDDDEDSCVQPKESDPKQARKENQKPAYDSDEDDQLLTQALNEQETRFIEQDNTTVQGNTPSPPTKKAKSLIQTLFEEDDEDEQNESQYMRRKTAADEDETDSD